MDGGTVPQNEFCGIRRRQVKGIPPTHSGVKVETNMGTFEQKFEIAASPNGQFHEIIALVDTGAIYTWIPASTLEQIGVTPTETRRFETADGRIINRPMARVYARMNGRIYETLVIFGDENTQPLMGAYTLEGFGLWIDPVERRLIPIVGPLKGFRLARETRTVQPR